MNKLFITLFLFAVSVDLLIAQANYNLLPQSSVENPRLFAPVPQISLQTPNIEFWQQLDMQDAKTDRVPKYARAIAVDLSPENCGIWTDLPDGGRVWRVQINAEGAQGLVPLFNQLLLPPGATLHVYNPPKTETHGAYTNLNTPRIRAFNPGLTHGSSCVIEYYEPRAQKEKGIISIDKVSYAYRWISPLAKSTEGSGSCEVNAACSEGDNWRNQIRSVAKIDFVNDNGDVGSCSGALINNARQDCTPYILSAGHCTDSGLTSAPSFEQWVFHFNMQTLQCSGDSCGEGNTIQGCTEIAYSDDQDGENGSDLLLLQLSTRPPASYNVYYSGWDNTDNAPQSGVSIHHPSGDCKKISTYSSSATSGQIGNNVANTHWSVTWVSTANGFGQSEPGSSGCPLYNQNGLIVGHLTGGNSGCPGSGSGNPGGPDLFGKIWFDWTSNGATSQYQLQPWLDPDSTGISSLPGMNPCTGDGLSNDAGIADVRVPKDAVCGSTYNPEVLVRNYGSDTLFSVEIQYGSPVFQQPFTGGPLPPGTDAWVTLSVPQAVSDGVNLFSVNTAQPNGTTDANHSNDTMKVQFEGNPASGSIILTLHTDDFGSQTSWQITAGSSIIASGGPYIDERGGKQYIIPLCVPAECMVFTIFDSAGNGIVSGENGSVSITGAGGTPVFATLQNPAFGSMDTLQFCVTASGVEDVSELLMNVSPNPSSGIFKLEFTAAGNKNLRVFDITGRQLISSNTSYLNYLLNLTSFSNGIYILQVEREGKNAVRKLVLK